jgi:hypothetical protein
VSILHRFAKSTPAAALVAGLAIACADTLVTGPDASVVSGLTKVSANDSSHTTDSAPAGSGYFRGTVLGPSPVGSTGDTLGSAPRIAGVRVTIYARNQSAGGPVETGPALGSVVTGTDGLFQLPTLAAGEYVVTFVPPEDGNYRGVYSTGQLRSNSSSYPWWVILPRK